MAVIDVCTFNGEDELFEIRYNILKDFVDEFRVIEFDQTFSGRKKETKFNQKWSKVKHYFITEEIWGKYKELAKESPNTQYGKGAQHWITEFAQKESLKDYLTDLQDEDIIYLGDADELWQSFPVSDNQVFKLKLRVYTYWLNNHSSEEFWGTIVGKYKNIKGKCLNYIRSQEHIKTKAEWGWHFTSLAPYLRQKLKDSYTIETYASQEVINSLEDNIKNNRDFLGRDFKYKADELELPKWLLDNKSKYEHLFK